MDAVKFLKARKRMCDSFIGCSKCPVYNKNGESCFTNNNYEDMVKAVEEWAAAHPRKTRQSVFLKQFPNAKIDKNGVIIIAPCTIEPEKYNAGECAKNKCICDYDCRHGFWMQEVE